MKTRTHQHDGVRAARAEKSSRLGQKTATTAATTTATEYIIHFSFWTVCFRWQRNSNRIIHRAWDMGRAMRHCVPAIWAQCNCCCHSVVECAKHMRFIRYWLRIWLGFVFGSARNKKEFMIMFSSVFAVQNSTCAMLIIVFFFHSLASSDRQYSLFASMRSFVRRNQTNSLFILTRSSHARRAHRRNDFEFGATRCSRRQRRAW